MDDLQFETRAQRRSRKRIERKQAPTASHSKMWLWILVGLLVAGGIWWIAAGRDTSKTASTNSTLADQHLLDSCSTDMFTTFHIHAHLTIIVNGQEQVVPADTGINSSCMHVLHTHDSTGIIHIESPTKKDFTLANFFYIWKKDYSATSILDNKVTADTQLKLFVDGKEVTTGPETIMKDKTSYAIVFGPAKEQITPPANYQFPANL